MPTATLLPALGVLLSSCLVWGVGADREGIRRSLWMGEAPGRAAIEGLSQPITRDDSVLVSSVLLALGDSVGCLAWLSRPDTSLAWEVVEARRLHLLRAAGEDVSAELMALWRRFPHTELGRSCALAVLEGPRAGEHARTIIPHLQGWPAPERVKAWWKLAIVWGAQGRPDSSSQAWWRVVEGGIQPLAAAAAETLLRHLEMGTLRETSRLTLAEAFLSGNRPHCALEVLPASPASESMALVRARALVAVGRTTEGRDALRRLAQGSSATAAEAIWYLGTLEKRLDRDSLAAEHFLSLVRRFPAHRRAPEAAWESAWAFERIGSYDRAGAGYRELIRRWPHGPNADNSRFRWGLVAWRFGDVALALRRWDLTWPHLRDGRAKAAVAYWRGKGALLQGALEEATTWWERAVSAASESFYGLRAAQRLSALSLVSRITPLPSRGAPDLTTWVRGWAGPFTGNLRSLERARRLYDLGFATEAHVELRSALDEARSAGALAEVAHVALSMEAPDVVASAALSLAQLYETKTGGSPPSWLMRLGMPVPFAPSLWRIASSYDLDPRLVSALIRKESFYDRTAVSRAGATGLMQLMPRTAAATAREHGGIDPTRLEEVTTNLTLGCLHLRHLLDRHGRSLTRALAAYNAGSDRVSRWVSTLPRVDEELWVECITYGETRAYVKAVLALFWRYAAVWPDPRRPHWADELPLAHP